MRVKNLFANIVFNLEEGIYETVVTESTRNWFFFALCVWLRNARRTWTCG